MRTYNLELVVVIVVTVLEVRFYSILKSERMAKNYITSYFFFCNFRKVPLINERTHEWNIYMPIINH